MQSILSIWPALVANPLARIVVIFFVAFTGLATAAFGQFGPRTNASYGMSGTVSVTGGMPPSKGFLDSDAKDGGPNANPVELRASEGESIGSVINGGNVFAFADIGSLAVTAQGFAGSQTSSPPGQIISSSADFNITNVTATWSDRARVSSASRPAGTPVRVNFSLDISGGFEVDVPDEFFADIGSSRARRRRYSFAGQMCRQCQMGDSAQSSKKQ